MKCLGQVAGVGLQGKLSEAKSRPAASGWIREANRGTELEGKTIGIYGYGNTGSAFAKLLRGFDVKVLAYDKYKKNYGNNFVKESSPEEIFSEADVLSLHLPLTDETNYLVNDSFISKFKKNIYIINTSRGQIVKTDDLVKNIKSGKILGACLDVLEYEENSFEAVQLVTRNSQLVTNNDWKYLTESKNIILTPHIAGWSFESQEKMAKILAEKIISLTSKSAAGSNPV